MPSLAELGKAVKAKYPGAYDKASDEDVGRAVRTKYPDAYQGYTDEPGLGAKVAKYAGETVADAAQGATSLAGVLDPAVAALETGLSYVLPMARSHGSVGDRWRESMGVLRDQRAQAAQRSPIATQVGAALPAALAPEVMAAGIPAPFSQAASQAGASLLPRAAGAVADSALFAGATAASQNMDRPDVMSRAGEVATSPWNLTAGVMPAASELAPKAGYALGRALPKATRTPAADYLRREGVQGLTLGQEAPDSPVGIAERASADSFFGMKPERRAAQSEAVRVAQDQTVAPGAKPSQSMDPQARHAEHVAGYKQAYDKVRGENVPGADLADLPDLALRTGGGNITAAERKAARNEIGDALTILPGVTWQGGRVEVSGLTPEAPSPLAITRRLAAAKASNNAGIVKPNLEPPPPPPGVTLGESQTGFGLPISEPPAQGQAPRWSPPRERTQVPVKGDKPRLFPETMRPQPGSGYGVAFEEPPPPNRYSVGDLVNVRSRIRDGIRDARSGSNPDWPRVRQLQHAEGVLSDAIDAHLSDGLRGHHQETDAQYAKLMVVEGAGPAGNPEFTGGQGLQSLARSTSRRALKSGQGGGQQDYFEAMRDVFADAPMTGARSQMLSLPGAKYAAAPFSRLANTPSVKAGILRDPYPFLSNPTPPDATAQAIALANALRASRE